MKVHPYACTFFRLLLSLICRNVSSCLGRIRLDGEECLLVDMTLSRPPSGSTSEATIYRDLSSVHLTGIVDLVLTRRCEGSACLPPCHYSVFLLLSTGSAAVMVAVSTVSFAVNKPAERSAFVRMQPRLAPDQTMSLFSSGGRPIEPRLPVQQTQGPVDLDMATKLFNNLTTGCLCEAEPAGPELDGPLSAVVGASVASRTAASLTYLQPGGTALAGSGSGLQAARVGMGHLERVASDDDLLERSAAILASAASGFWAGQFAYPLPSSPPAAAHLLLSLASSVAETQSSSGLQARLPSHPPPPPPPPPPSPPPPPPMPPVTVSPGRSRADSVAGAQLGGRDPEPVGNAAYRNAIAHLAMLGLGRSTACLRPSCPEDRETAAAVVAAAAVAAAAAAASRPSEPTTSFYQNPTGMDLNQTQSGFKSWLQNTFQTSETAGLLASPLDESHYIAE
ncbi:unnamed protein product [Protopolystoma xenopodis]|uniref:Uncharacterized protein n=1 Tax=Protopolystoma xenopodis TaxID=117903 RepID=A0A448WTB2_9PLAT|nr:unnamed protein product [Protopolystoma xenopodis]